MSRGRRLSLLAIVPLLLIGGFLLGRRVGDDDARSGLRISDATDAAEYEHDYLIPEGTAARIVAGESIEIVPAELVVRVGDALRIVNEDSEDHIVGVFFVAAGETLTQRFNGVGVLTGECSVHPSGSFTLRVVEA